MSDPKWLRETTDKLLVRIPAAEDWCRIGWIPTATLEGTHHGDWSVMMAWLECKDTKCRMERPSIR